MFPRAKKAYGQNFLADRSVVQVILETAAPKPGEVILEIGPGTGVLTQALVASGARVVAVEADADLMPALQERFNFSPDFLLGDILALRATDPTIGGRLKDNDYALVANIPYNITSALLEDFLTRSPRPTRMILMLQKEVTERLTARPPKMGLLSVVCQLYADVRRIKSVPRGAFRPMPKVDSAVIELRLHSLNEGVEPEEVIRLAKAAFSSPRKQLHGNLSGAGYGDAETIKKALEVQGIRTDARAETLTIDDWIALWTKLRRS